MNPRASRRGKVALKRVGDDRVLDVDHAGHLPAARTLRYQYVALVQVIVAEHRGPAVVEQRPVTLDPPGDRVAHSGV